METTWQKGEKGDKEYPPLVGAVSAEVVIVGGGITGITLAYLLAKEGKKVAVLEKESLLKSSITAYTTAMITAQVDTALTDLKKIFGEKEGPLVWKAGMETIDTIEKIIQDENISCEFARVPAYVFSREEKEWKSVEEEGIAATQAGFPVSIKKEGTDLNFPHTGYYILSRQAKFHPLKYCLGLRAAAEKYGALFYENTEALFIEGDSPVEVITKEGKAVGSWVVIATYNPFNKPVALYGKKGIYVSYMCELSIPKEILPEALYIGGDNPYHYFRVDKGETTDRLIIGGEDHRKEIKINPEKKYEALLNYAKNILGGHDFTVKEKWSGNIIESWDGLPFIGVYSQKEPHLLVATAFSGNGMTYSMISALILKDHILGENNPYAKIFDPKRGYTLQAFIIKGRDYMEELIQGTIKNLFK